MVLIVPGQWVGKARCECSTVRLPFPFSKSGEYRLAEEGKPIRTADKERRRSSRWFPSASAQKPIRLVLGDSDVPPQRRPLAAEALAFACQTALHAAAAEEHGDGAFDAGAETPRRFEIAAVCRISRSGDKN